MTRAALLCSVWVVLANSVQADDLGRLFFTPTERAQFDTARRAANQPQGEKPPLPTLELTHSVRSALPTVTVNGMVLRRHGPSTLWINGESLDANVAAVPGDTEHVVHLESGAAVVTSNADVRSLRIKPGQTYDPTLARVIDAYESAPPQAPAQ
jgi:hypothetical protein